MHDNLKRMKSQLELENGNISGCNRLLEFMAPFEKHDKSPEAVVFMIHAM